MRRARAAVTAATVLAVLGAGLAGPASATAPHEVRPTGDPASTVVHGRGTATLTAAEEQDLSAYLAGGGAGATEQQVAALRAQGRFAELVASLAAEHADVYAGAALEPTAQADAWILFTDQPSPDVLEQVAGLPLTVEVRWGAPATQAELEDVTATALRAVTAAQPDAAVVAFAEPGGEGVTVQYGDGRTEDPSLTAGLEAVAADAVADETAGGVLPVPVEVQFDPAADSDTLARDIFGGAVLRLASDHRPECTAGFTVRRGAERGLITARHCANKLHFGSTSSLLQFAGVARTTPAGNAIDLQLHRLIGTARPTAQFRATAVSDFRVATGASDPVVGQSVCKWGMTSGYTCDTVYLTNVCYQPLGLLYCGLFATQTDTALPGDSGGPWFTGTEANGLTSGAAVIDGSWRTLATKISMSQKYLGAQVLTGG
ncbi:MAG: hypothetical protein IE923_05235 [Micrococcales bacterium]|nr:hypothetical protein [Micrococcales bacterium]